LLFDVRYRLFLFITLKLSLLNLHFVLFSSSFGALLAHWLLLRSPDVSCRSLLSDHSAKASARERFNHDFLQLLEGHPDAHVIASP
jgi:pimeloyl-ACP methyl ester carboxylesterase